MAWRSRPPDTGMGIVGSREVFIRSCLKENSSLQISHFKRSANQNNIINLTQEISDDLFAPLYKKIIFIPPNFRITFFALHLYTLYRPMVSHKSEIWQIFIYFILFYCNCLFRPLARQSLQNSFHHCTFQVTTAYFVHRCTLKQALPLRISPMVENRFSRGTDDALRVKQFLAPTGMRHRCLYFLR